MKRIASARSAFRETDQQSARSASRKTDPRFAHVKAFAVLDRWGLTTLGEVATLPAEAFSARLGQAGIALQRLSRGIDVGPLVPDPEVPRFLERVELEWPIEGLEPLAFVLARLLEPLALVLERADRAAAAIHLRLRLVDRTAHVRMLQLPAAIRDPKVLRTLLILDLESHPPPAAIDIVVIEIDPAPGRVLQYSLLERARPSAETLATLTARLGALVGESRAGQAVLLDSHGPDAFEMRRFAPDERGSSPALSARDSSTSAARAGRAAAIPSAHRRAGDRRSWPSGVSLYRSARHAWRCCRAVRGPVAHVGGMVADPGKGPWNRDEWDVALSDGSVCRLFQARDLESAQWFLDGVVD